jgi:N-acetylneuraminic acid mutarotase
MLGLSKEYQTETKIQGGLGMKKEEMFIRQMCKVLISLFFVIGIAIIPVHAETVVLEQDIVDLSGKGSYAYDFESDLADPWSTKTSMPTARVDLTSSVVNGKIYAIGGWVRGSLATVEEYDPSTDTWTTKTSMPAARDDLTSSVVNGKIYAIGGWYGGSTLATVEEYDPSTDTWTTKTSMPTARALLTSSVVNGKIYVIGGWSIGTIWATVEEYDPSTDTWTTKTSMPTARVDLTSSVVNGKIYVIGGGGAATVEEYDPSTDTWTTKTSMPTARGALTSSVVNGKIYAIGGLFRESSDSLATVEEYDPSTDTWTTKTSLPTARDGLTSSVVNGKIYAIGGWGGGTTKTIWTTVEEYTPASTTGASPVPDIKANSSDGPVTPIDDLSITVALDSGGSTGTPADWWILASTPFGWLYFSTSGWALADTPLDIPVAIQIPLVDFSSVEILKFPVASFPSGTYTFYFAIETTVNGVLDSVGLAFDSVTVVIP